MNRISDGHQSRYTAGRRPQYWIRSGAVDRKQRGAAGDGDGLELGFDLLEHRVDHDEVGERSSVAICRRVLPAMSRGRRWPASPACNATRSFLGLPGTV